jgi:trehalose synthase
LRDLIAGYDASIFSLADVAQMLPHPSYIVPPAIDPLSEMNMELGDAEIRAAYGSFDIDTGLRVGGLVSSCGHRQGFESVSAA